MSYTELGKLKALLEKVGKNYPLTASGSCCQQAAFIAVGKTEELQELKQQLRQVAK